MDPIMMDEDQTKQNMEKYGKTHNSIPYQYNMNNKKRVVADREGLVSNEEEVEDIWDMDKINEILCSTYERKTIGPGLGI
jgi:hypothetical protein